MKNNYCLPVIKTTESEVLSALKANEQIYSFFEVWVDYIEDLKAEFLLTLLKEYKNRLVFVFRRKNLEKPQLSLEKQLDIVKNLENQGCLVDMDVYDQSELIRSTMGNKLKTIISYHNYRKTPDEKNLYKIVDDIEALNPEIIKISTFCTSKSDVLILLKLMLELQSKDKKHIILGMGKEGIITRLYGAIWGNELTFIPENKEEASAPGQMTRTEFENMLKDWKVQ